MSVVLMVDTHYYHKPLNREPLKGFASFFDWMNLSGTGLIVVSLIFLFLFLLTSEYPNLTLRILSFLAMWISYSLWSSYNPYILPRVPWVIAALALVFFVPKQTLHEKRNLIVLRFIQGSCFVPFFLSGFWKLINFLKLGSWDAMAHAFYQTPLDHLAYFLATGAANPVHSEIILKGGAILPFVFFFVCFFQFSCFLPILFNRLNKVWAYLVIAFILANGFVVGIHFHYMAFALAIMVIFTEEVLRSSPISKEEAH